MNSYAHPQPQSMHRTSPLPGFWGIPLNTASLYGIVLLRHRFGERFLTTGGVLLGLLGLMFLPIIVVVVFTFFLSSFLLGSMGGLVAALFSTQWPVTKGTIYFHSFVIAFLAKSCWHFVEMEYRRRAGAQVVSSYSGRPSVLWKLVPGFGRNEDAVKRFGEPAALLLFALWIRQTDFLLCLYLGISALAMFVRGHFEYLMVSQRIYDLQDQMMEGQALGGTLRGQSNQPGDMGGVAVPALLDGYVPHQAQALGSTMLAQSPLSPIPADLPSLPPQNPGAGLPPEYGSLLSLPTPTDEPVQDWFVEESPPIEDWFLPIPVTEQTAAKLAKRTMRISRVFTYCPACSTPLYVPKQRKPDHRVRCTKVGCGERFVINKETRCFCVRHKTGDNHAA